jgi:hypothetical protein
LSAFESQHRTLRKEKYLKGTTTMANPYDVDSNGDDPKVAIAEWTWGKAPISCPWVNESENTMTSALRKPTGSLTCC